MSDKVYDIEEFQVDLEAFLKANLNAQITLLNAEKNDSITLAAISDDAYFQQSLNETVTNYSPFLLYGIFNIGAESMGPITKKSYTVFVSIFLTDPGYDTHIIRRLLRYQRALEDLFSKNWATLKRSVKIKIQSLRPEGVVLNETTDHRVIGVLIDFTLA